MHAAPRCPGIRRHAAQHQASLKSGQLHRDALRRLLEDTQATGLAGRAVAPDKHGHRKTGDVGLGLRGLAF